MTKTILFYDLETSGLIKDHKLPSTDPSHPHVTQLAAVLRNADGVELARMNRYIKPDGWALDDGILAFNARAGNGITQDRLETEGTPIAEAMAEFYEMFRQADAVVQWDKRFLGRLIRIESKRLNLDADAEAFKHVVPGLSLMKAVVPICQIPKARGGGYKSPNLQEACQFFLNHPMAVTNNAQSDVEAIMNIYDIAAYHPDFVWPNATEEE